ncbi:hypothetical protein CRE_18217 [Caenorhabditis remanei]|uniref:Uncharacterized protein n=1 Tax=Caenorhabditis remanei TaxID=31234 RepID=E3NCI8_CAERE|nr:hypothetical protein CRE_18217 [Caenorhabditis remanei]
MVFPGNMTLFITPGVREFVQQYRILVYLCTPLPIVSKLLITFVERISSINRPSLLLIPVFILHLLAIFLSFTALSLFFDTEIVYFSCFIIFMNTCELIFYTLQNYSIFSSSRMLLLLIITSLINTFLLPTFLSIFAFPYVPVFVVSLIVSFYINFHICHFMDKLGPKDWPQAVVWMFSRIPV